MTDPCAPGPASPLQVRWLAEGLDARLPPRWGAGHILAMYGLAMLAALGLYGLVVAGLVLAYALVLGVLAYHGISPPMLGLMPTAIGTSSFGIIVGMSTSHLWVPRLIAIMPLARYRLRLEGDRLTVRTALWRRTLGLETVQAATVVRDGSNFVLVLQTDTEVLELKAAPTVPEAQLLWLAQCVEAQAARVRGAREELHRPQARDAEDALRELARTAQHREVERR